MSQEEPTRANKEPTDHTLGDDTRADAVTDIDSQEDLKTENRIPAAGPVLGWVDLLYGVITQPSATLRVISGGGYIGLALTTFFLVEVVNWYLQITFAARGTIAASLAEQFPQMALPEITRAVVNLGVLFATVGVAASFIFLFLGAGIFNLLAEILNGKGNARGLLAGLAMTALPSVLGAPIQFLAFLNSWPSHVITITSLVLWLWMVVLKILAVREATGLSTARATAVYLIPWGSIILLVTVALVGGVITLAPLLSGFNS